MARFVVRRVVQMLILFVIFLTVTWFLLQAIPGDFIKQRFSGIIDRTTP